MAVILFKMKAPLPVPLHQNTNVSVVQQATSIPAIVQEEKADSI